MKLVSKRAAVFKCKLAPPLRHGFGDASTKDERVFSFVEGDQPCFGLDQAVDAYRALVGWWCKLELDSIDPPVAL